MKLMRMLAVIGLLASSSLAYGQDERPVMTVNVPFAFRAAGVSLPAGHYKISRDRESQLWKLRTFGHTDIYVTATPRELRHPSPTSLLLFDLEATGYTLRQIQEKAQTGVAQLVQPNRSKEHRSAAQEVASVTALAQ